MSHDPQGSRRVDEATRALREEGDAPAPQAKLTRERILRDLRPRAKSRRWVWAVPVAALLAGSTVLAATGQLPVVLQTVGETAARMFGGGKHAPAPPRESTSRVATSATSAPLAEPAPAPEPPPAETSPLPETPPAIDDGAKAPRSEPPARRHAKGPDAGAKRVAPTEAPEVAPPEASATPAEVPPKAPETDETLALYRKAHRLHFVEQNPGAALTAWDEYLAKKPKGPLVVDALYDRAVCLVRLGRRAEAKAALEPFADGRYGSYRQKDARALLEALTSQ